MNYLFKLLSVLNFNLKIILSLFIDKNNLNRYNDLLIKIKKNKFLQNDKKLLLTKNSTIKNVNVKNLSIIEYRSTDVFDFI